jgi:hypothetical protein
VRERQLLLGVDVSRVRPHGAVVLPEQLRHGDVWQRQLLLGVDLSGVRARGSVVLPEQLRHGDVQQRQHVLRVDVRRVRQPGAAVLWHVVLQPGPVLGLELYLTLGPPNG